MHGMDGLGPVSACALRFTTGTGYKFHVRCMGWHCIPCHPGCARLPSYTDQHIHVDHHIMRMATSDMEAGGGTATGTGCVGGEEAGPTADDRGQCRFFPPSESSCQSVDLE